MAIDFSQAAPVSKLDRRKAAARLRLRVSDILNAALGISGLKKVELGQRLGLDRSSVTQVLRGNGNVTMNTLAEYLAAMGMEADIQVVRHGEIYQSMCEHRAPRVIELTIRDAHRVNHQPALVVQVRAQRKINNSANSMQPSGQISTLHNSGVGTSFLVGHADSKRVVEAG